MKIDCHCPHCRAYNSVEVSADTQCAQCKKEILSHPTEAFTKAETLNQCPVCGSAHLYQQKDFNRKLGIGLLVVGVLLSYVTYGISLLVVTAIDLFLYNCVGTCGVCYSCKSVFRNSPTITQLDSFDLKLHDYYRSLQK